MSITGAPQAFSHVGPRGPIRRGQNWGLLTMLRTITREPLLRHSSMMTLQRTKKFLPNFVNEFLHPLKTPLQVLGKLFEVTLGLSNLHGFPIILGSSVTAPLCLLASNTSRPNPIPGTGEFVGLAPRAGIANVIISQSVQDTRYGSFQSPHSPPRHYPRRITCVHIRRLGRGQAHPFCWSLIDILAVLVFRFGAFIG